MITTASITSSQQQLFDEKATHPLQSFAWGLFREKTGVKVVRKGMFENGKLIATMQLTIHPLPFTSFTIGYFPKGSLPTEDMLSALVDIGKEYQCLFIQLEPNETKENGEHHIKRLMQHNTYSLVPSHHPLFTPYTFSIDLTQSEETLLAAMHPKTRYNIKVAKRHDVTIQEDNSEEAFTQYLKLNDETTKRQGFYAHSQRYHQQMWEVLHNAKMAHLFTATYENTVLAAWIIFVWNKGMYYPYGTSSRTHREVMAPYLLLWELIRWGKKKNLHFFDLWGALEPNPNTKDPWYGFHRFKEGFHPRHLQFVGSYDLILHPFLYRLFTMINSIRWTILRIKKSFSS